MNPALCLSVLVASRILDPLQREDEIYCLVGPGIITSGGGRDTPPQNMPLGHKNSFELEALEFKIDDSEQSSGELSFSA